MNKKFIILLMIFVLLSSCFYCQFVFAIDNTIKNEILSVENDKVTINSNFNLDIDFTKISAENFKLILSSNLNLGEPTLNDSNKSYNLNISLYNNMLETTINKSDLKLDCLSLNYAVPNSISIGSTIEFKLQIYDISNNDSDVLTAEDSIILTIINESDDKDNNQNEDQNGNPNYDKNNNFNDEESSDNNQKPSMTQSSNMPKNSNNSSSDKNSLQQVVNTNLGISNSSSSNLKSETISYNGSSNNYLSNLSVDGYSFTSKFVKTNTSYFLTVDNAITSININAISEDTSSTVCVYGNSNLNIGVNKILVNVTSENGSVKTYRIYVTRAS